MAWNSAASRAAPAIWALAASWVGSKRPPNGNGDLLLEEKTKLGGEAVLGGDPGFVGGGSEGENGVAADRRRGKAGDEGQKRLPFEGDEVGGFDRRRDGIEKWHAGTMVAFRGGARDCEALRMADCGRLGPDSKCGNGAGGYEVVFGAAMGQDAQPPPLQGVSALDSDLLSEEEATPEPLPLEG